MIKRKIEIRLEQFYNDNGRYALLVDGARKVGKTFIIEKFAAEHYEVLVEINFATMKGAPIDLTAVRGRNAAADCVLRSGKGKVADLVQGGRGLLAWCFQSHGVGVTGNPDEEGVRFLLVGTQQIAQDSRLAGYLKANADPVGCFAVTRQGVSSAAPDGANLSLYRKRGVPPPPPKSPWRQVDPTALTLGILSVLGTVAVGWIGLVSPACRSSFLRQR